MIFAATKSMNTEKEVLSGLEDESQVVPEGFMNLLVVQQDLRAR